MSTMYRLKAYFGMVPADEMDYVDEPDRYRGAPEQQSGPRGDRWSAGGGRFADPAGYDDDRYDAPGGYDDGWAARTAREPARPARAVRQNPRGEREPAEHPGDRGAAPTPIGGSAGPAVRGALAMDPDTIRSPSREPQREERPTPLAPAPAPVPEQRDRTAAGPASITTLHPRSYTEARTIGERYREGVPVIMNLTDLDDATAKRLVDFAAGLVFALRGGFDKVTNRVFLLTPADVEVSADDARRLAERGAFRQD
ncbi:cell division protein SepF [Pseudonocardia sp. C8]|uniref:cell division protein SepF n=1 Tax=Pseudonocardia sp. C8 TaxID=2762759 RepID=UPI0016425730|nr:cell division protein SepF [Pseudonocardia sp. C8]MBC3191337.1 cell division protein SepF [Pseudonocardia sp. C8]